MSVVADIHLIGLASARPAASSANNGYLYTETDTNGGTTYRSNGSTWVAIAGGVSGGGTPSGAAGGDLTGTYPNPTLAALTVDTAELVDAGVTDAKLALSYIKADGSRAFTGDQALGAHKLTGLTDPTLSQDAATKAYVDSVANGLDVKASIRVATTANITLSGTQTIDGVACIAGNRVLVKDQTTGSENGIYVVGAGAWARATDADASAEVTAGLFTFTEEGSTNGNAGFVLTTANPITVGVTALTFQKFTAAGGAPSGAAGGDLTGSYPNPTLANNSVDSDEIVDASVTDLKLASTFIKADGSVAFSADQPLGAHKLTGVANPTSAQDAATKTYVDSAVAAGTGPTGSAGGDLSGTYPNPSIAALAVTDSKVAAANKDGAAGTASMRTLGTGSTQSAAGNHTTPVAVASGASHAAGHLPDPGASAGTTKFLREDMTYAVPPGATIPPRQALFTREGAITAVVGNIRIYNKTGVTWTISNVFLSANVAPTGASILVDVNKNGTTIFTTQANRPSIVSGANTGAEAGAPDVTTITDGDYLSADVDQVGSTVAGNDLTIHVVYS